MAVKTPFSSSDFAEILAQYSLGSYTKAEAIAKGTVQTNFIVYTAQGKFVFRYYENRSEASVRFECELLKHLAAHHYPCPRPLKRTDDTYVGLYRGKPYMLFTFIDGTHIDNLTDAQQQQLIQYAAALQNVTNAFDPPYKAQRWNYDVDLCRTLAHRETEKINTPNAHEKFAWLDQTLSTLELPETLPKGICHCDFDLSNILFREDKFVALLDFDDANYTYLTFDLVGLMEYGAWPHQADALNMKLAHAIVQSYTKHRPLSALEQHHLFDVYKLSILIDCVWFFERGHVSDFYEKRKIDFLNSTGREGFKEALFPTH